MPDPGLSFLDVSRLLQASLPRRRAAWVSYALIAIVLLVLTISLAARSNAQVRSAARLASGLLMLGVVVGMAVVTSRTARLHREERQRIAAIEELVQLRKWDQAASMLQSQLGQPAHSHGARLAALIFLANVLARYHRFADAMTVQDYLLEHGEFDPGTAHALKLMRAMAMLHEDQLVDADRAMAELRREAPDSGGLALVEIYRDVKTGHAAEAIEHFEAHQATLRTQLGHRVGDAYALVARAYDMLGQTSQAAAAFERATLLSPIEELYRRYPEVAAIQDKFPAVSRPREAA